MSRKDALLRLHKSLVAKRESLRKQLAEDLTPTRASSAGTGDVCDAAMDDSQNELHSQLAALESRELHQIDKAIRLIRDGRYGCCEVCGCRIPIARLNALPFTTFCVNCQQKQESHGGFDDDTSSKWESAYEFEGAQSDKDLSIGDLEIDYE